MKQIKSVVFVINRLDAPGGAERVVSVLSNRMVEKGIRVSIIVRQNASCVYPLDDRVNICATTVDNRIPVLRNIIRNFKLRKALKHLNPDVVISFMTSMNIQTILFSAGLRIPVIISERNNPETDISKKNRVLAKILYPYCDGVVFQTQEAADWFSTKIRKKSIVIPNPISEDIPRRGQVVEGRIVSVGRLTKQKNQKLLIDAFCNYSEDDSNATLSIYGQGNMMDELKRYIKERGMDLKITLEGFSSNVMQDISDAELFILSSDYEGMPNALIEAMGIGIPCISTDCPCGGAAYLIEDGVNGMLTPVGDVEAMTKCIRKVMRNREFRENLGMEAIKIRERLDSRRITDEWLAFCRESHWR